MNTKKKFYLLKILGVIFDVVVLFGLTTIGVLLNLDYLWKNIDVEGFTSFWQWLSLVLYRLLLYLLPGLLLSLFKFDKRYKFISRFKIWLNWTLGIFLFSKAIISVFSIDKLLHISIFGNLDGIVLLVGYVFTLVTKQKVEFDSTGAIINPKEINQK